MQSMFDQIANKAIRYLAVAVYTLVVCFSLYWLIVSIWWCGIQHPWNAVRTFTSIVWHVSINLWYGTIPMVAVVILDVQRRLRERRNKTPNQAVEATS